MKKRLAFPLIGIAIIIISFIVWDFVDAPPFWHFRQADKKVILEYQSQHYPGTKAVKSNFPLLGNPSLVGVPVESSMTFEYNNVEFSIAARDKKLTADFFHTLKQGFKSRKQLKIFLNRVDLRKLSLK